MIKTEFKLIYQTNEEANNKIPVIIVAAGSSSRMKGINKQLLEIGGIPVIAKTLLAFENSPFISRIILVTKEELIPDMQNLTLKYNISKLSDIAVGGENRFSSVIKGFERLDINEEKVLIHDGARPFVDNEIIGNVVAGLQNFSCVVCGVPLKDTVKIIDENNKVVKTPDRKTLTLIQTPQGVDVKLYKSAAKMLHDSPLITDDASVMEEAGYKVKVVKGKYSNIKITTPEDIKLAMLYDLEENL